MNDHPGNEPPVTLELAQDHNLTDDEYERIQRVLGRVPTYTELGIFSVMWSEHCSYKNTRPLLRTLQIARGCASGVGNPVFYVGPPTGRDGLAGAAFASQALTEKSAEQQRVAVQVRDSFMEKLVCEACLELLATGAVAGIQDMGAAGLTCSICETAARAGTGIEIELAKVPQRAPNMSPYEIMLSESQERMLIIVRQGRDAEVKRIFDKWDLPWAEIGTVADTGRLVVRWQGQVVADIPTRQIADESPVYEREAREPRYLESVRAFTLDGIPDTANPAPQLISLLSWSTIASKNWTYRQYDHMVRDGSVVCPGSDAVVIRIKADSVPPPPAGAGGAGPAPAPSVPEKLVALTVDCNGTYVFLDPYEGGKIAVAEAARNLACSGARPVGVTDNLNAVNPRDPGLFWQLRESVRGLGEACRIFQIPITGGNCSLYNRVPDGPVDPTPTIAMVGLIDQPEHIATQWFKDQDDAVILLGEPCDADDPLQGLGGSAFLQVVHGQKNGRPPRCDPRAAQTLHDALRGLICSGSVKSAHDCSEGGLAVCLAECCVSQQVVRETPRLMGASIDLSSLAAASGAAEGSTGAPPIRLDALLFGETQNRVVITTHRLHVAKVLERARLLGVAALHLGWVGGDRLTVRIARGEWSWTLSELHDAWWNSIGRAMA